MLFLLDLSNTKNEEYPDLIPCETGQYEKDIDVIESMLSDRTSLDKRSKELSKTGQKFNNEWPIGFNLVSLPIGATLTAVDNFDGFNF